MTRYSYREDQNVPDFPDDRAVIVFDGMCVMCSSFMRFILRHDRHHHFNFLPAQSPIGEALFAHYDMVAEDYDSVLLIENCLLYTSPSPRDRQKSRMPSSA